MSDNLIVGDLVEAFGLVGASHLNGQYGWVEEPMNAQGRVAVKFFNEDTTKRVKRANLKEPIIPDDKDDPRYHLCHDDDGTKYFIRIEGGAGHSCVDCGCNLDGQYYVAHEGIYRCERDFIMSFSDQDPRVLDWCIACNEYVPKRQSCQFRSESVRAIYPNGRLPDEERYERGHGAGAYVCVHWDCYHCTLCKEPLRGQPVTSIRFHEAEHGRIGFLCEATSSSTDGCANEWEEYLDATKRLREIQAMTVEDIQTVLRERNIPFADNEDKDLLVRKVILTDKAKERKSRRYADGMVIVTRLAPGAVLRDRTCMHGFVKIPDTCHDYDDLPAALDWYDSAVRQPFFLREQWFEHGCKMTISFWMGHLSLLRVDVERRWIPSIFWMQAVGGLVENSVTGMFAVGTLVCIVILNAMMDQLERNPVFRDHDGVRLIDQPDLKSKLQTISQGPVAVCKYMHHPDHRRCNCLAYVATAAELGLMQFGTVRRSRASVEHCAQCGEGLVKSMVCSLCKQVAYCNAVHQREHWKIHKKTCAGRVKK